MAPNAHKNAGRESPMAAPISPMLRSFGWTGSSWNSWMLHSVARLVAGQQFFFCGEDGYNYLSLSRRIIDPLTTRMPDGVDLMRNMCAL